MSFLIAAGIFPLLLFFLHSQIFLFFSVLLAFIPLFLYCIYQIFKAPEPVSPKNFKGNLIAHRGGRRLPAQAKNGVFPENSLAAFRYALTTEADGIELDTWLSKDKTPVVIHDHHVQGHFQAEGPVSQFTVEQLKSFKYKRPDTLTDPLLPSSDFDSERIPTLEEVIQFIASTRLKLMIEIKENIDRATIRDRIVALYAKYPFLYERSYVASFDPFVVYSIRRKDPKIVSGYLYCAGLTQWLVGYLREHGEPVSFWLQFSFVQRLFDCLLYSLSSPPLLRFLGCSFALMEKDLASKYTLNALDKEGLLGGCWVVNEETTKAWLEKQNALIISDELLEKPKKPVETSSTSAEKKE